MALAWPQGKRRSWEGSGWEPGRRDTRVQAGVTRGLGDARVLSGSWCHALKTVLRCLEPSGSCPEHPGMWGLVSNRDPAGLAVQGGTQAATVAHQALPRAAQETASEPHGADPGADGVGSNPALPHPGGVTCSKSHDPVLRQCRQTLESPATAIPGKWQVLAATRARPRATCTTPSVGEPGSALYLRALYTT